MITIRAREYFWHHVVPHFVPPFRVGSTMNLPDIHRSRGVQSEAAEQRRQCEVPSMDFRGNQGKSTSSTGVSAISMGLVTTMADRR